MPRGLLGLVCALTLATAAGCGRSAEALAQEAEDRARLAEVMRESEELHELLAETEARLYSGKASVSTWSEFQARHEKISAIACKSVENHVAEMTKHDQKQRRKRAIVAKRRLAEVPGQTATDVHVSGLKVPASIHSSPSVRTTH